MQRSIGLLTVALVIFASGPALAQCAWALWNQVTYIGPRSPASDFWVLIDASPDYLQCEKGRTAKARDLLRVTESDRSGPNVARVTAKEDGNIVTKTTHLKDGGVMSMMYRLICLPDTIDPRGPSGTSR
jgi:hypothetical protein